MRFKFLTKLFRGRRARKFEKLRKIATVKRGAKKPKSNPAAVKAHYEAAFTRHCNDTAQNVARTFHSKGLVAAEEHVARITNGIINKSMIQANQGYADADRAKFISAIEERLEQLKKDFPAVK